MRTFNPYNWASPSDAIATIGANPQWNASGEDKNWAGGRTVADSYQDAIAGNDALVANANDLIDEIRGLLPESAIKGWAHDVFGEFPSIPRYLANASPQVMRRRVTRASEHAPIRVFVDMAASHAVSADDYAKRGAVIMTMLDVLSRTRAVDLYAVMAVYDGANKEKGAFVTIKIPSSPMNIGLLASWLGHVGVFRNLILRIFSDLYNFRGSGRPFRLDQIHLVREMLGCGDNDLYVSGCRGDDLSITDPRAWLKAQLTQIDALEI